jgi:hypothetical protein
VTPLSQSSDGFLDDTLVRGGAMSRKNHPPSLSWFELEHSSAKWMALKLAAQLYEI